MLFYLAVTLSDDRIKSIILWSRRLSSVPVALSLLLDF